MEERIHTQFLIDDKGEKSSALLPIEEYNTMLENAQELEKINALLWHYITSLFHETGKFSQIFQKAVQKTLKSTDFIESSFNLEDQKILLKAFREFSQEFDFSSEPDEKEPTKKEILDGIKQGLKEVELHRQGKLKLKSAKELLDEL
ncbi:hypothetical protein LEP1GSC083_2909 [Leptospira interrogans serovar Pyrogenes str. L0374]|uniref:Uncharacterized protein n=1 Tax=Leptospira interrogans serovar Pyrogenes str. L0374 TaxID=1049928 RepID=M6K719_LEPIR|nr:hypothetical protein LEP1GSC111_0230 [Leptospira interrogans str. UT126]EMN29969.1 hypothetical protein LEP1GSC083_2909 [Leptospira interrogans serovar Pyrogenes str. L0374]EMN33802.1 hypothetical protein LEP1GSC084_1609 [Leptospira interrogans serovar Medanensis str. L0448]EMN42014.1 hypothetical protein LEP1GSC085_0720 [Leptospira interrogans str. L0996]